MSYTKSNENNPLVIPITLQDYWYESISQEQILQRLKRNDNIEKTNNLHFEIPKQVHRYLLFKDGLFREYVKPDDQEAILLVTLPCKKKGDTSDVLIPIFSDSEKTGNDSFKQNPRTHLEYKWSENKLTEKGLVRGTIKFENGPTSINVNAGFIQPDDGSLYVTSYWSTCCRLCRWVHDTLGIEELNSTCCSGRC